MSDNRYVGQWEDDFKHGQGTETWVNDGSSYVGQYKYGKKEGHGKYTWHDGSYYEGSFVADNIEGNGTYFSHSCTFTGAFKDNVKQYCILLLSYHKITTVTPRIGVRGPKSFFKDRKRCTRAALTVSTRPSMVADIMPIFKRDSEE